MENKNNTDIASFGEESRNSPPESSNKNLFNVSSDFSVFLDKNVDGSVDERDRNSAKSVLDDAASKSRSRNTTFGVAIGQDMQSSENPARRGVISEILCVEDFLINNSHVVDEMGR
jgi:hypothetical protein